jgi:hypothetical protein
MAAANPNCSMRSTASDNSNPESKSNPITSADKKLALDLSLFLKIDGAYATWDTRFCNSLISLTSESTPNFAIE